MAEETECEHPKRYIADSGHGCFCYRCLIEKALAEQAKAVLDMIREKQKDQTLHPMFLTGLTWVGLEIKSKFGVK